MKSENTELSECRNNIRAVETDKGILFFSDTVMGEAGFNAYLQYLTDHYFDNAKKDCIHIYRISGDDNKSFFDENTDSCFIRIPLIPKGRPETESDFFDFDKAVYIDKNILSDYKPIQRFEVKPETQAYQRFTESYSLQDTARNVNIKILLDIYENGVNAKLPLSHDPRFDFDEFFRIIYDNQPLIQKGVKLKFPELIQCDNTVKAVAKNLLMDLYKLNTKRELQNQPLKIIPPQKDKSRKLKN